MRQIGRENASFAYISRVNGSADIVSIAGKVRKVLDRAKKSQEGRRIELANAPQFVRSWYHHYHKSWSGSQGQCRPARDEREQKDAHGVYPDVSRNIARASIGRRRQTEYSGIIAKYRPNLRKAHC